MSEYADLKAAIIQVVEEAYLADPAGLSVVRASLGDVGSSPNWNTVDISGNQFLAGAAWNPKPVGSPATDGPDLTQIDKTVIGYLVRGLWAALRGPRIESKASLSAGEILCIGPAGGWLLADSNDVGTRQNALAVALADTSSGDIASVHNFFGHQVTAKFSSTPVAGDVGNPVYLSNAIGKATTTEPSATGSRIYSLGVLLEANGTDTCDILWAPSYVGDVP